MQKVISYVASAILLGSSMSALAVNENAIEHSAKQAEKAAAAVATTTECVLPTDNTAWDAAAFDNNGKVASFHPVPWVFQNDGTASAEGHWTATWKHTPNKCGTIDVVLTTTNGATDIFEVVFVTPTRLIGTKGGNLYRFGKKR